MTDWVIAVPVWGAYHTDIFANVVMPALKLAMAACPQSRFRFILHTEDWSHGALKNSGALSGIDYASYPVPPGEHFHTRMGHASRDALAKTNPGEVIAFINADMVPSVELFVAGECRLNDGYKLLLRFGTRTLAGLERPPIGAMARDLSHWCWEHRHPWIKDTTWGTARSATPSMLHFAVDGHVVVRAFHLHPWAMVKDSLAQSFSGVTIDVDLMNAIPEEKRFVHTDADELSFAEISPLNRNFGFLPYGRVQTPQTVAEWARHNARGQAYHWQFGHRITLVGNPGEDFMDVPICNQIMESLIK